MVNIEELRFALKVTEEAAKNGLWDQHQWLKKTGCGTAGCLAGNYLLAIGCQPNFYPTDSLTNIVTTLTKEPQSVEPYATRLLGLNSAQAKILFSINNSLEDLRRLVDEFCAEDAELEQKLGD